MRRLFNFIAMGILVLPSIWLTWFVLNHLYLLYLSEKLYSFGINLQFGPMELRDPWSDVLILLCAGIATVCGIAQFRIDRRSIVAFAIGAVALAVVAVGVTGMLLE